MVSNRFLGDRILWCPATMAAAIFLAGAISWPPRMAAQAPPLRVAVPKASRAPARPKLVVLLVVDQMRADYVDKFLGQWTGGLKRLVEEGAWFRDAAYPYAATETCVGHATISTGAFPATHGMVANAWWDRKDQKMVTCTADPDPQVKNIGYAGATPQGADTAWRMAVPSFAEELKFQRGGGTRVVTFSLKARASLTMAGHKADAATWFDGGAWVTSSPYSTPAFIEEQAKSHPPKADFGKTWALSLPEKAYWYDEKALGAIPPAGWELTFPHPLRGKSGVSEPDARESCGLSEVRQFQRDRFSRYWLLLRGYRRPRVWPAQPRNPGRSCAPRPGSWQSIGPFGCQGRPRKLCCCAERRPWRCPYPRRHAIDRRRCWALTFAGVAGTN